jgi:pimeloyl-ACP methyl ester carboxylesterase
MAFIIRFEFLGFEFLGFGLLCLLALQAVLQAACVRMDARKFPAPGRLVNIPGGRMHVQQSGKGGPAVVFEAGIAASSLNWALLQPLMSAVTTTYSYDRAGFGWSTSENRACTLQRMADDLHALLDRMAVPRPYILVGHSFAAYILRVYALRYADELAGVVLVDPLTPEEWIAPTSEQRARLRRGVWFSRAGGALGMVGVIRFCLWLLQRGSSSVPRRVLGAFGMRARETVERILGELAKLPPDVVRLIRERWSNPKFFWTMAAYIHALPACAAEVAGCDIPSHVPVTVISGAHQPEERMAEHTALARHSLQGRHIIADKSAHWIHLDQPALVVEAFREMTQTIKTESVRT